MRDTAPAVGTDCLAHTADLHSFPSRRKFKKKKKRHYIYIYMSQVLQQEEYSCLIFPLTSPGYGLFIPCMGMPCRGPLG